MLENDSSGHALSAPTSLAGVATNIDLTQLSGVAVSGGALGAATFSFTLPSLLSGQNLIVTAAELTGGALSLHGVSGSNLVISTNIGSTQTVDLSSVDSTVGLAFASSSAVVDGTLILTTNQASGKTLTGTGTVQANVVSATPAAFDLQAIATTGGVLVDVQVDAALATGTNLGSATVAVDASTTLSVDAGILSGHAIYGAGTLALTGSTAGSADLGGIYNGVNGQVITTVDLTGVTAGTSLTGATSIFHAGATYATATIADGQAFVLTAAQLSGNALVAGGTVHSGTATVVHGDVAVFYDFSHQSAFNGISLTFDTAGQMDPGTTGLSHFAVVNLAATTTSLSAAQADSVTWGGLGGVSVVHGVTDAVQHSLNGTAYADDFSGHGANDLINLTQDTAVSDTLVFSGLAHDFDVTGFTVTNLNQTTQNYDATGGDVLDFRAVDGGNAFGFAHLDLANLPPKSGGVYPPIGDHQVLVVDNFAAADATAVQVLFNAALFHLNDRLVSGSAHDEILVIDDGASNANIWRWTDTGDHKVQANELTLMGTLHGLTIDDGSGILGANDLSRLQSSHIIG